MASRLLTLLLAAGLLACDDTSKTLLVVEISSDLAAPDEMDEVQLEVRRPGDQGTRELSFQISSAATIPLRAGLIPWEGGEDEEVTLIARARKQGKMVVRETIEVSFQKDQRRIVKMYLVSACVSDPCTMGNQTCTLGGGCGPRRRGSDPFTDTTPRGDGGSDGPAPDAPGQPDGGADASDDSLPCPCPSDDNPCTDEVCEGGNCLHKQSAERSACPGGLCTAGACCTGCLDGMGRCRPGTNVLLCGAAGASCAACNDNDACTQDKCEGGACRADPLSGNACPSGVCVNGQCHCGGQGEACCQTTGQAPCEGGLACVGGTCGACGAMGQGCCSSNTCASGLLCTSGNCIRCGEISQPCCPGSSCRVGVCGGNNQCAPCGGVGQACCKSGDACGANLACQNGTCACGAFNQPCCDGSLCTNDRDACNGTEVCQAGRCARAGAVVCKALDTCHTVGVCDPASGKCSDPPKPDNSTCTDGNACSSGDACKGGVCTPVRPTCDDGNSCTRDTCLPTGCTNTSLVAGTACTPDTNMCTEDVCDGNARCTHPVSPNGKTCTTGGALNGRCSGGACCPILMPNCAISISPP